jgi:hypothetical protein
LFAFFETIEKEKVLSPVLHLKKTERNGRTIKLLKKERKEKKKGLTKNKDIPYTPTLAWSS